MDVANDKAQSQLQADVERNYSPEDFHLPKGPKELDRNSLTLSHSFGFDSFRRSNIFNIKEKILMYIVGNVLHFLNVENLNKEYFHGFRNGSIGAVAIHPSRKYIALAEKSVDSPNIYILEYPSMNINRVLRNGTHRSYSSLSFNIRGDKLASVGGDPDYMMTIWDWNTEQIILRYKAFSQDVYNVAFHPQLEGMLTTSGMGHIKFWKMSNTFTGLKLQGAVGKFGLSELSDINSFIHLPDGKVLSGTESGVLLLWEGGAIKCELGIKGIGYCHEGPIDVVILEDNEVITGGDDGYIRVWDLDVIDNGDVKEPGSTAKAVALNGGIETRVHDRMFELEPLEEILVGKDVKIKSVIKSIGSSSEYFAQDGMGHIYKLDIKKHTTEKIYHFHAGTISAMEFSTALTRLMTLGQDGSLRLFDYMSNKNLGRYRAQAAGTYGQYLPLTLDPMGTSFIAGFADGVVRIIKHSAIAAGQVNFTTAFAFKPHSLPLTVISISPDGRYIVTGADDSAIFIFRAVNRTDNRPELVYNPTIQYCIQPLGFFTLSSAPNVISWSPLESDNNGRSDLKSTSRRKFIIATKTGQLFEATTPDIDDIDNEISFKLESVDVSLKEFTFEISDDIARAEAIGEAAWRALVEEENKKAEEGKPSNAEEREKNPLLEKDSWKVKFARKSGINAGLNVRCAVFFEKEHFLLSAETESGEGQLRVCHIGNPKISRLICTNKSVITTLKISASGNYLMFGTSNGSVYFQPFVKESYTFPSPWPHGHERLIKPRVLLPSQVLLNASVQDDNEAWVSCVHDSEHGTVKAVGTSFDDSHFCSVGQDGGLFIWKVAAAQPQAATYLEKDLMTVDIKVKPMADITNPTTYSIQEAKLKSERDREMQTADERKKEMKREIGNLRDRFNAVLRDWQQSSAYDEDRRWKIGINTGLKEELDTKLTEKIDVIHKSAAWQEERDAVAVEKIRKRFLGEVGTERIILQAFKTTHKVATFRTSRLQQSLWKQISASQEQSNSATERANAAHSTSKQQKNELKGGNTERGAADSKGMRGTDAKSKLEVRKLQRAERALSLKNLIEAKPDEDYEDPADISAIRLAKANMGDYKLKSSPDYIVPETECVNTEKKKSQFFMLKDSIQMLKDQFNGYVFELRDRKVVLVDEIKNLNSQVSDIDIELLSLGIKNETPIWIPKMEKSAFPETRKIVTEADIDQYLLEQEKREKNKNGDDDPLGGFSAGKSKQINETKIPDISKASEKQEENTKFTRQSSKTNQSKELTDPCTANFIRHEGIDMANGTRLCNNRPVPLSSLEKSFLKKRIMVLQYRKKRVLEKIDAVIKAFDTSVDRLATERMLLEGDMKFAEIKLLLVFREWLLLKDFEKMDEDLTARLNSRSHEKRDIDQRIKDCQEKLQTKRSEVESVIEREKLIQEDFTKIIGENNKHEDFLNKLFKRKVRRNKKRKPIDAANDAEQSKRNEEDDFSDDEDDDSIFGSDDYSDSEETFDETCPGGCDKEIYRKTLELREKRLDEEEKLSEIQKAIDILKKEHDSLLKKERTIDAALKQSENEIRDFQTMKQKKLNELDVCLPLRLHQILVLENDRIASDLSKSLVFQNTGLHRLRERITELEQEKTDIRKQHNHLKRMHVNLVRSKKEKQDKLSDLENRLYEVQMLKFGRTIDLEKLEKLGLNKTADELREKLMKEESARNQELEALDRKITELKDEYNKVLARNTELLENFVSMRERKNHLESTLNAKQSHVNIEFIGTKTREDYDLDRLEEQAGEQESQILTLKSEIEFLRTKPHHSILFQANDAADDEHLPTLPIRYPSKNNLESLVIETKTSTATEHTASSHRAGVLRKKSTATADSAHRTPPDMNSIQAVGKTTASSAKSGMA